MRYFRQGLVSVLSILAMAFAIYGIMRLGFATEIAEFTFHVAGVSGMMAMGFMYRRWNGPLVFTSEGVSVGRLSRFALGGGVILGPLNMAGAIAEGAPLPSAIAIALLLVSPLLAAASLVGPMLFGSWFFDAWILRSNKRLQTDSSPPVSRG